MLHWGTTGLSAPLHWGTTGLSAPLHWGTTGLSAPLHWRTTGLSAPLHWGTSRAVSTASLGNNFCWLVACLTSQQQARVSQGRICSDNFTCCHTEIEVADPTLYLTQSQYTDTGLTSSSADPITPGAWQGSHWSANFEVTGMTRPRRNPGESGIRTRDLPLSRRTPKPLVQRGGLGNKQGCQHRFTGEQQSCQHRFTGEQAGLSAPLHWRTSRAVSTASLGNKQGCQHRSTGKQAGLSAPLHWGTSRAVSTASLGNKQGCQHRFTGEQAGLSAPLHWGTTPRWPSGKASASRAGPGFESRLRRDFLGFESYQ